MEISVYLKDYVEKLKKDKMKPFYNKKNNNFEIDNIYDYLKIIDILQNEKEKDRNAVLIVALPRKNLYDGLEKNPGNLYTYLGMVYVPNSLFFKTPSYITEREKRQSSVFMLFANSIVDVEKDTCISDEEAAYLILEGEEYYKKHYGSEKSIFKLHPTLKRLSKQQYQMNFTEVIIPKKVKKDILRQLSNIGISKSYLFPEMEYTAEYIKNKYIFGTQRLINGNFDADYEL